MSEVAVDKQDKLTFGSSRFSAEKYELVAANARLTDVCLVKQDYMIKVSVFWSSDPNTLTHGFMGQLKGAEISKEKGVMAGGYAWSAEVSLGRKKVLKLTAEYLIAYSGLSDVDEDHALLYFEKLARFTSYPYFRAIFSQCTANSGVALPPLPSLVDRVD